MSSHSRDLELAGCMRSGKFLAAIDTESQGQRIPELNENAPPLE
jgi:hypothetical protein